MNGYVLSILFFSEDARVDKGLMIALLKQAKGYTTDKSHDLRLH